MSGLSLQFSIMIGPFCFFLFAPLVPSNCALHPGILTSPSQAMDIVIEGSDIFFFDMLWAIACRVTSSAAPLVRLAAAT